jgi:hypothetical protein
MFNCPQVQVYILHTRLAGQVIHCEPHLAGVFCLAAGSLENVIWPVELAAHVRLHQVHKVLRVIQDSAIEDRRTQPGMQAHFERTAVLAARVVGYIQMHFIGQSLNFTPLFYFINVYEKQIDICGTAQQWVFLQYRAV